MRIKTYIIVIGILFINFKMLGQQSVFYTTDNYNSYEIKKFGLTVYNLNFIKNNEYFNFIADGYTLLGTQLHSEFIYNNSKNTQFRAGVFLLKNFGENKIDYAIPTFSFKYKLNNHHFTIGNIFAGNNHGTIEPILASEKILSNQVIETGLQYKYNSHRFNLEAWLDWENYIRKNDDFKEVFTVGISGCIKATQNLSFPVQFLTRHKGGQINKKLRDSENITDIYNIHTIAIGSEYVIGKNTTHQLKLSYFFLAHTTDAPLSEYPFTKGNASYIKATYKLNNFHGMIAYYTANKFITAKGNEMFSSYSLKTNNNYWNGVLDNRYVNHTEPNRTLLFGKFFYEKTLAKNICFGAQVEGFLQLNESIDRVVTQENKKNNFDYSYGIYIRFNDVFNF